MSEFLATIAIFNSIAVNGYVVVMRTWIVVLLFVFRTAVYVAAFLICRVLRNRLRRANQERENLRERLRLVSGHLSTLDGSLAPVVTMVEEGTDTSGEEERLWVPRLRLNEDGSITEYS